MGYYYEFYDPEHKFKKVAEGSFSGMSFYWNKENMPIEIPMFSGLEQTFCGELEDPYNCTGLLGRKLAVEIQKYMKTNKTLFTDLMDENHTDTLVFRIT